MSRRSILLLAFVVLVPGCGRDAHSPSPPRPPAAPPTDPIPEGYFTLTPRLTVQGVDAAVDFYVAAFGAEPVSSVKGPGGDAVHAEIRIGDSIVMLDEANVEPSTEAPPTLGGPSATLMVYLEDADSTYATAVEAGAAARTPIEERLWGDRYGEVIDPFGHRWALATHVEDLTPDQLGQRAEIALEMSSKKARKKSRPPKWRSIAGEPASDPKPESYHTVTIVLTFDDATAAIEQYEAAFGAEVREMLPGPDGTIMHGELMIGDSVLVLSDARPGKGRKSTKGRGGSSVVVHMYVDDVDVAFARAMKAGATEAMAIEKTLWGERYGAVIDAAGFMWGMASRVEEVSVEEVEQRLARRG